MAPSATLTDAGGDRAVVSIGYDVLGPGIEVAEASAGLVAKDHCEALGKSYELVWSKREAGDRRRGEYVFYYACARQRTHGSETARQSTRRPSRRHPRPGSAGKDLPCR